MNSKMKEKNLVPLVEVGVMLMGLLVDTRSGEPRRLLQLLF